MFRERAGGNTGIGDDDVRCTGLARELLGGVTQGVGIGNVERMAGNCRGAYADQFSRQRLQLLTPAGGKPK